MWLTESSFWSVACNTHHEALRGFGPGEVRFPAVPWPASNLRLVAETQPGGEVFNMARPTEQMHRR